MASAQYDYSRPAHVPRPHDLLMIAADTIAGSAPAWARSFIASGAPVVVRRAPRDGSTVPIGVRGGSRGERHADHVPAASVTGVITPESLIGCRSERVPALRCVGLVAGIIDAFDARIGAAWGITGAVGYELATGRAVCHAASDLDLVLRMPERLCRGDARALYRQLNTLAVRCDVQLETPLGGVALADWASTATRCLVKSDAGPFLSSDPWRAFGAADTRDDEQGSVMMPCRVLSD